mgnify:CR=1 FL=1
MTRHVLPHRPELKPPSWAERDRLLAVRVYRAAERWSLRQLLAVVSVLGNGPLWYAAIAWLAIGPFEYQQCAVRMLLLGMVNLLLYYVLKRGTGRPRPYEHCVDIRACVPALDRFSFPSGHTLHAVAYSVLLAWYFPSFALPLALFTGLVMVSGIALGLHYPSDVLAALLIGLTTGGLMLTTA